MNPNRLLAVLGLTGFASNIAIRIVDPIVPVLAREFNVTVAVAALLASAYTLPYALGQPILGPLGDAKGKARVMSFALLVLALGLAGSMFAWDIASMAAFRAISGLAAGATIPLGIALIGDRFPLEERQVALSRYLLAIIVGQLSGAPLAGIMADTIGWRPVFGIAAFFALIAGIAVGVMIKPQSGAVRSSFNLAAIKANYRLVLSRPLAKYCYGAVFAEGVLIYGFLPYVADLLEQRGSGGVREAGFVVAGIGVGGLLFNLVLPSLLRRTSRPTVMALGGMVILAGMTGVATGATWQAEMAAFTVVGLGFYMLHTGIQVEVTEFAPEARGSAIALHAFCLFLGMAIGPVVYGQAIPLLGAPLSLVLGGIGVLAAALLLAAKVQRPR
ncbi:MAG: MFS transporter [Methylocystis sp.]|nr:MFS transporter [Methylocystis sp.]MCA3584469.1 MFS transporter [Methylocystis sp.]MCA3588010.1 MFS transporter [Methylocystis sp.]MCA3590509.1 MFS transporter [Methylocystis sp.]